MDTIVKVKSAKKIKSKKDGKEYLLVEFSKEVSGLTFLDPSEYSEDDFTANDRILISGKETYKEGQISISTEKIEKL